MGDLCKKAIYTWNYNIYNLYTKGPCQTRAAEIVGITTQ